jgi:hypothetical protein
MDNVPSLTFFFSLVFYLNMISIAGRFETCPYDHGID